MALTYFAADGSYGDAAGLVIIDTRAWGPGDWQWVEEVPDGERASIAVYVAQQNGDI